MTNEKFEYEKEIIDFWQKNNIYNKVKQKNKGSKLFNTIDGPPYPTGEIHLGHLRNWTIKDSILRFKRLQGFDVYARDGYDAHGLPVENKVEAKLGLKTVDDLKKFGEENFVSECKKFVSQITNDMTEMRERFGLWMDRTPYYTFHPDYISLSWRFFKKAEEKGLLYKDYKTVAWCPHDETTLSDYEIKDTYKILEDPSIYVKFQIKKEFYTTPYDESILIWTTTPWTLQSNMAVAMHPKFEYSKVLVELNQKKEVLILANILVEKVISLLAKQNDIKFIKILETKKGAEYEGIKYNHIYLEETPSQKEFAKQDLKHIHSVVMADFVTLGEGEDIFEKLEKKGYKHSKSQTNEDENIDDEKTNISPNSKEGTGIVHIAPGHGFDDYNVGKKYNIPIFCPVGPNGKFSEGKYEGKYFKDIDPIAIDYLRKKGFLLYATMKSHRYPCCWRCKTPIVYRATDQWWIKRSEYLQDIIKENSNVKWYPASAKTAFNNLMENASDWAISRQRYWGTPLPIFEDEDGNYEVFGSKEELEERVGHKLNDIHTDDLKKLVIKNKISGKNMKSVPFIADVWFDSGAASFASHYGEGLSFSEIIKKYYPIKWVTEGEDQIRGWFSSLFGVGQILTNKAPYNEVLFQRFIMDKDGQKMSKSLGNGISGNEAIDTWGADTTRYYLAFKRAPEEQINFDAEELSIVSGFFNTLENLVKYIDSYLNEYEYKNLSYNFNNMDVEDKWILYKLNQTIQTYTKEFEHFRLNQALKVLEEFIVKDLSKTYLKIIKDRTTQRDNDLLAIFDEILKKILIMLCPIIPFRTEYLYKSLKLENKKESLFLENMPICDELVLKDVEKHKIHSNFELAQDIIQAVLNAREKAKIGIRWPLGEFDIISPTPLKDEMNVFEKLILKIVNISKIKYNAEGIELNYVIKPNFANLKQDFNDVQKAIKIINLNKYYISEDLKLGEVSGTYGNIKIDYEKHIIKDIELNSDFISSDFKGGNIILHTKQDEILLEEGYLRELIRKIQSARKDLGLNKSDEISISFDGSDEYFLEISQNWSNYICTRVGAKQIVQKELENKFEQKIKDKNLIVSINKV